MTENQLFLAIAALRLEAARTKSQELREACDAAADWQSGQSRSVANAPRFAMKTVRPTGELIIPPTCLLPTRGRSEKVSPLCGEIAHESS